MNVEVIRLINPSEPDIERAAHVLVEAFKDDLANKICVGGDMNLCLPFHKGTVRVALLDGQVHVAVQQGRFVGVVLWFPPGDQILDSTESKKIFNDLLDSFPQELSEWWKKEYIPGIARLSEESLGSEEVELNSWTLQTMGVLPEYQGKGVGTAMFRFVDSKATGSDLFVEADSEDNVAIYRTWGFTERGRGEVKGCSLFPAVFTLVVMLKDA